MVFTLHHCPSLTAKTAPRCARRDKASASRGWQVLSTHLGLELTGLRYEPLFPYFKDHAGTCVRMRMRMCVRARVNVCVCS